MGGVVSDGYGNEISVDEYIGNYKRWSHTVAGGRVRPSNLMYDDLVQEALIELWKITQKKPEGVNSSYVTQVLRHRINNVAAGAVLTGGDSKPGPKSRPKEIRVDWQEVSAGADEFGYEHLLEASDLLSAVEWAYHEGEILKCLSELPETDRLYVYKRFWEGKTDTEIAAETGVTNKYLGGRWKKQIRPALLRSLAHLVQV